jgi:hypothetical protein
VRRVHDELKVVHYRHGRLLDLVGDRYAVWPGSLVLVSIAVGVAVRHVVCGPVGVAVRVTLPYALWDRGRVAGRSSDADPARALRWQCVSSGPLSWQTGRYLPETEP